jgi:prolipoprotein diacylglyceryl transferase
MQTTINALSMIPAGIPSPGWSGFTVGPLTIHAYALCILAGIIAALWLTTVRWRRRGGPQDAVWDIAIWAIPFGIIGGRLYHVFSSPDAYFGPGFDGTGDLSLIPQIWLGGLGIWGAVALGVVGAWIGCRRAGVKLTAFIDAAAPGLLLAQAIGRWGNWFNQELFGAPTDLPWGLRIDPDSPNFPAGTEPGTLFHPTFLYESLWNLAGVVILLALDRKFHFRRGRLFWLYAAYYTLGRVWIEAMRIDDAELIFGVRLNVWTSILVFLVAIAFFIVLGVTGRNAGTSVYLPGREPGAGADDAEADSAAAAGAEGGRNLAGSERQVTKAARDEPGNSAAAQGQHDAAAAGAQDSGASNGADRGNLSQPHGEAGNASPPASAGKDK